MPTIFLLRHADYGDGSNPGISEYGKRQALALAEKIKSTINGASDVAIWSSAAKRAVETAAILQQELSLAQVMVEEKLWSDNDHQEDFQWLKGQLEAFEGQVLIIVSHLEYVREFPATIGFWENNAGYAEGVKIENGECINF